MGYISYISYMGYMGCMGKGRGASAGGRVKAAEKRQEAR